MKQGIEQQRKLIMQAGSILTELAGHESYYKEAIHNPGMNQDFLASYHLKKTTSLEKKYAEVMTQLFFLVTEQLGLAIIPKNNPTNVVELAEQHA